MRELSGFRATARTICLCTAFMLALLPSCSNAQSDKPDLSPQAEKVVNEAADLLFGSNKEVSPMVDFRKYNGGMSSLDPSCYGYAEDLHKIKEADNQAKEVMDGLNSPFSWLHDFDIVCDSVAPLDKNIAYDAPTVNKDFLRVVNNITPNLRTEPVLRRPAKRFRKGFFAKSGSYCELWLRRNEIGQINFAAVRILSKPPKQYDVEDNQQQECFIRGSLMALGLEGAAEMPFEKLAFRAPFPVGLKEAALHRNRMRRYTQELVNLILYAASEEDFVSFFTRRPINRDKFIEILARRPDIEKVAEAFARIAKIEQEEREAKTAPPKPPFKPPRPIRHTPEPSVR